MVQCRVSLIDRLVPAGCAAVVAVACVVAVRSSGSAATGMVVVAGLVALGLLGARWPTLAAVRAAATRTPGRALVLVGLPGLAAAAILAAAVLGAGRVPVVGILGLLGAQWSAAWLLHRHDRAPRRPSVPAGSR